MLTLYEGCLQLLSSSKLTLLTGQSLSKSKFKVLETDELSVSKIADVIDGQLLGVVCHNYVKSGQRELICENFWKHEGRYTRGADAPAEYLGVYHYGKALLDYLAQSKLSNATLASLFTGVDDPVARLRTELSAELSRRSRVLRLAHHNGMDASSFVMRSWVGSQNFALAPHEDAAQCADPLQNGFEIQPAAATNAIAAVNICLQNGEGGKLRIWNIRPDNAARAALGLEITGSPYPVSLLDDFDFIDVDIKPGDLYVFDGRFLHAVTSLNKSASAPGARATIAFLMANLGKDETISWT